MYGSLNTSVGENRTLYMAEVVGRNCRYPHNGVTMSYALHDATSSMRPSFRSLTPKKSDVTVDTRLLVKCPPGRTRQKIRRNIK
jgi:hypothetical protein